MRPRSLQFRPFSPQALRFAVAVMLAFALASAARAQQPSPLPEAWLVNRASLTTADQTMAATLQGLVAKDTPAIWIQHASDNYAMTQVMLNELAAEGTKITPVSGADALWGLVDRFRDKVKGAILYDATADSLHCATSLCGPLRCIAVDATNLSRATQRGLALKADTRGMTSKQLFTTSGTLFAKGVAVELDPTKNDTLRDFAVMSDAFTFYDKDNTTFRTQVASYFGPQALVYGWGPSEYEWVGGLSKGNAGGVPTGLRMNLSAMAKSKVAIPRPYRRYPAPAQKGERIVAFVMSDGDNLRWMLGQFISGTGYWGSPHRGKFCMNWSCGPLTAEIGSRALRYFYNTASKGTNIDCLVGGPSGASYTYPSLRGDRAASAAQTARLMAAADMRVMEVINANNAAMNTVAELLDRPEIMGILYKDYAPYNDYAGQIYWRGGKPAMSFTYMLWDFGAGRPDTQPAGVAQAIAALPADPAKDVRSYALITVHAWSFGAMGGPMEAVKQTIDQLPAGVRVVTAEELIILLRNNFGTPVPNWANSAAREWTAYP